jgi:hypothetical protein
MAAWAIGPLHVRNGQTLIAQNRTRRKLRPRKGALDDFSRKGVAGAGRANRAVWLSVLASFPKGLRPIWLIADLLATGTYFFLPVSHRDRHQRSLGHASRKSHSRLCWFDSLLFVFAQTTSFLPVRSLPLFFGLTLKLTAGASRESTNWRLCQNDTLRSCAYISLLSMIPASPSGSW